MYIPLIPAIFAASDMQHNIRLLFFCCRMLVLELFREKFPVIIIPDGLKFWSNRKKLDWLVKNLVRPLTEYIYLPLHSPSTERIKMKIHFPQANEFRVLYFPPEMRGTVYECVLTVAGKPMRFKIRVTGEPESLAPRSMDEVHDLNLAFLRSMMDFVSLEDITRAGDIDRLQPMCKRLIPLFLGLTSYYNHYATEMIDFLTKTEHLLSARQSISCRLQLFCNPSGKPGHNKPTDMQQENNVKGVKHCCRGMGASKNVDAMVRTSKAAVVLSNSVKNLEASLEIKDRSRGSHHKDETEDRAALAQHLRLSVQPFQIKNRKLGISRPPPASAIHTLNRYELNKHIKRNSDRSVERFQNPEVLNVEQLQEQIVSLEVNLESGSEVDELGSDNDIL